MRGTKCERSVFEPRSLWTNCVIESKNVLAREKLDGHGTEAKDGNQARQDATGIRKAPQRTGFSDPFGILKASSAGWPYYA
jgi:hypothetical protein